MRLEIPAFIGTPKLSDKQKYRILQINNECV